MASWQVAAWEPAFVTEPEFLAMVPAMRHISSSIQPAGPNGKRRGSTLWGLRRGAKRTGIAWDWVELRRGIVAMEDPMMLLSNLRILEDGEDGCELPLRLQRLNWAVNTLDWQDALCDTLEARERVPGRVHTAERLAA